MSDVQLSLCRCKTCGFCFDNVHRVAKIFPTCYHVVCSQCICEVSDKFRISCPRRRLEQFETCVDIPVTINSAEHVLITVNAMTTFYPSQSEAVIYRILKKPTICDSPFCCSEAPIPQCKNLAIKLFKPSNLFICNVCWEFGCINKLFDEKNTQNLVSIYLNYGWLRSHLAENRRRFVQCPVHCDAMISLYCRTCHTGICNKCLARDHAVSHRENCKKDIPNYYLHNVKAFDKQAYFNEVAFINAYQRNLKLRFEELTEELKKLRIVPTFSESIFDEIVRHQKLLKRLLDLMTEFQIYCSAEELSSVRPWFRNEGKRFLDAFEDIKDNIKAGSSTTNSKSSACESGLDHSFSPRSGVEEAFLSDVSSNGHEGFLSPVSTKALKSVAAIQFGKMKSLRRSNSNLEMPNPKDDPSVKANDLSASINDLNFKVNRQPLRFKSKIGQHGDQVGQFTEPSGLAVTGQNHIVVADSNGHRIQVFNRRGRVLKSFGENRLQYPNRVAVNLKTGWFYATERPKLKLVQVFDGNYQFIKQFAEGLIEHPRAICVDSDGYVLILQGLVMKIMIFDETGKLLRTIKLISEQGEEDSVAFPTAMCVSDKREIFVTDNTKHTIFVYSYEGALLRKMRSASSIWKFPIGIAINHRGELVVLDNHETFNITIISTDGTYLKSFNSLVKHASVYDCCLVDGGRSVVMSCKDFKLYIYAYETPSGKIPKLKSYPWR